MFYKPILSLFVLVGLLILNQTVRASDYRLITSTMAPMSIPDGADFQGYVLEIVKEVDRRLGNNTRIENIPWNRAQQIAAKDNNVIIFPMTRLPVREESYSWVGRVAPVELVFVTTERKITSLDEARQFKKILVHRNAPPELFLKKHNFKNIYISEIRDNVPLMLEYGRIDAWFTARDMAEWSWLNGSYSVNPIFSDVFSSAQLFIAGSKRLSVDVIQKFQQELTSMRDEGRIEDILSRYRLYKKSDN